MEKIFIYKLISIFSFLFYLYCVLFYTVCTVIYLFMNTVENIMVWYGMVWYGMVWFDEIFYIPNEYRLINRRSFIVTFLHSE